MHHGPQDVGARDEGAHHAVVGEVAGRIGFDPWLHTKREIDGIRAALPAHIELVPCDNLIDRIWNDRPAPPQAPARAHPMELAGESSETKRTRIAASLAPAQACVLTLPDSICWLLNIRGADIPRNPVKEMRRDRDQVVGEIIVGIVQGWHLVARAKKKHGRPRAGLAKPPEPKIEQGVYVSSMDGSIALPAVPAFDVEKDAASSPTWPPLKDSSWLLDVR